MLKAMIQPDRAWATYSRAALAGLAIVVVGASAASAQTLDETLSLAWRTNPLIAAERAQYRATSEGVAQARAAGLPQITARADYAKADIDQTVNAAVIGGGAGGSASRSFNLETRSAAVEGEQVIFAGLRNLNAIREAKARRKAGHARMVSVEQDTLVQAAEAYFDVVRDTQVLKATKANLEVLAREFDEATALFDVGEATKTDVAQTDARLALARAQLTDAETALAVSRDRFAEIVGRYPETLDSNPALPETPADAEAAKALAREFAPALIEAQMREEASRRALAVAKGQFSPTVSATAGYRYAEEPSSFINKDEQFAYGLRVTAPIFLGGLNLSRTREARAAHDADENRVVAAERHVDAAVNAAWLRLQAAKTKIISATKAVAANELALGGVRREAEVGSRTTLDVLDAEQELLDAQVALASARRDEGSATFNLLAAIGVLTAQE
ncbi:MAG: TolC family outer membrane protein [Amphiplicatus sp.]